MWVNQRSADTLGNLGEEEKYMRYKQTQTFTRGLMKNVQSGVELYGALKGIYEFGRGAISLGRMAAPYVAGAAALL